MNDQQIRAAFYQLYQQLQALAASQQALNNRLTRIEQLVVNHLKVPHTEIKSDLQHVAMKEIELPASFDEFFENAIKTA